MLHLHVMFPVMLTSTSSATRIGNQPFEKSTEPCDKFASFRQGMTPSSHIYSTHDRSIIPDFIDYMKELHIEKSIKRDSIPDMDITNISLPSFSEEEVEAIVVVMDSLDLYEAIDLICALLNIRGTNRIHALCRLFTLSYSKHNRVYIILLRSLYGSFGIEQQVGHLRISQASKNTTSFGHGVPSRFRYILVIEFNP